MQLDLGRWLTGEHRFDDAEVLLSGAAATFDALHAPPLLAACEEARLAVAGAS